MTQYVLQVVISGKPEDIGWLIRSHIVPPDPTVVPPDRQQLVTENTTMFEEAVAYYKLHGKDAYYTITGDEITWELRP